MKVQFKDDYRFTYLNTMLFKNPVPLFSEFSIWKSTQAYIALSTSDEQQSKQKLKGKGHVFCACLRNDAVCTMTATDFSSFLS